MYQSTKARRLEISLNICLTPGVCCSCFGKAVSYPTLPQPSSASWLRLSYMPFKDCLFRVFKSLCLCKTGLHSRSRNEAICLRRPKQKGRKDFMLQSKQAVCPKMYQLALLRVLTGESAPCGAQRCGLLCCGQASSTLMLPCFCTCRNGDAS